eukprot:UN05482
MLIKARRRPTDASGFELGGDCHTAKSSSFHGLGSTLESTTLALFYASLCLREV